MTLFFALCSFISYPYPLSYVTLICMKRRLPIGIQDFPKLREGGFVYVDKTARIYELIDNAAGPIFLSRPRRFGKSLLCATLGAIFEGRRELFAGLAIDSLDWDWNRIRLSALI